MEPIVHEYCHRQDWPNWKGAIEIELKSLEKREAFGQVTCTPKGVRLVGYKLVFVRKCNL